MTEPRESPFSDRRSDYRRGYEMAQRDAHALMADVPELWFNKFRQWQFPGVDMCLRCGWLGSPASPHYCSAFGGVSRETRETPGEACAPGTAAPSSVGRLVRRTAEPPALAGANGCGRNWQNWGTPYFVVWAACVVGCSIGIGLVVGNAWL